MQENLVLRSSFKSDAFSATASVTTMHFHSEQQLLSASFARIAIDPSPLNGCERSSPRSWWTKLRRCRDPGHGTLRWAPGGDAPTSHAVDRALLVFVGLAAR